MSIGILIPEGQRGTEAFIDPVEADMRRWFRNGCVIHRRPHEIFIEVAAPKRLNVVEGIKRLASFGVEARAARIR